MSKLKEILKGRFPPTGDTNINRAEEEILKHYIPISEGSKVTAKLFHDTYERLAPIFGYETREDTKEFDPDSWYTPVDLHGTEEVCYVWGQEAYGVQL